MILGFKPEFVDKILSGTKIHSIREDKNRRWKPGRKIHFATGARTKNYKQFKQGTCCSVQTIAMDFNHYPSIIMIDRKRLSITQKMKLVENDGFKTYLDFWKFFAKPADKYIFMGIIIHWTGFRYHHDKKGYIYGKMPIIMDLPGEVDKLPKHLQDWMDVDWSNQEYPMQRGNLKQQSAVFQKLLNLNPELKKIWLDGKWGIDQLPENPKENVYWSRFSKKVTRDQLKEIRKNCQDDDAMDAFRYTSPKTPKSKEKTAGLFGRFIAWILELIKKIPLILAYSIAGLILMVGVTILILWIMLNKGMIF